MGTAWKAEAEHNAPPLPLEKEIRTADQQLIEHSNIRKVAVHGTQENTHRNCIHSTQT